MFRGRRVQQLLIFAAVSVLVGCSTAEPIETASVPVETLPEITVEAAEVIQVSVPDEPENSDHGYRNLDPDRIPSFGKCETFLGWWRRGPVAVSFAARDALGLQDIAVSTQVYLRNQELDEDYDGVICLTNQLQAAGTQKGTAEASDESEPQPLQNASSSVDEDSGSSSSTPSAPDSSDESPNWPLMASMSNVDVCRVPDGRPAEMRQLRPGAISLGSYGMSNVGFPHSPDLFPISGEVNFVVAAVAFNDLPGAPEDVQAFLEEQTRLITRWGDYWSQGRINYTFQIVEGWVTLDESVQNYTVDDQSRGERTVDVQVGLANKIAEAVGTRVDWSKTKGIFALFPTTFRGFQGEWGGRGDIVQTPIGPKPLFFRGGGTFHNTSSNGISLATKRSLLWSYWLHEILHSQGMHLHAPGNGWGVGLDRNQYPSYGKHSGAINAWELFKMGWTRDSQVFCIDARGAFEEQLIRLTPLEVYGGDYRTIIIRTGEHEGLVVESRRPTGYSSTWSDSDRGIMVVDLDTSVMNDRTGEGGSDCGNNRAFAKFGFYLAPDGASGLENSCRFEPFILKPGQSVTAAGAKITLEFSGDNLDFVRVNKSSIGVDNYSMVGRDGDSTQDVSSWGFDIPRQRENFDIGGCFCCGCTPQPELD